MRARWLSTVFSLRKRASAIARLVFPAATCSATSRSRVLSAVRPVPRASREKRVAGSLGADGRCGGRPNGGGGVATRQGDARPRAARGRRKLREPSGGVGAPRGALGRVVGGG